MEWTLFFKKKKSEYDFAIEPRFPAVEELIERAERITQSCYLQEQVNVSARFLKDVAVRGLMQRIYSLEDTKKVSILVDHMAKRKMRELHPGDIYSGEIYPGEHA